MLKALVTGANGFVGRYLVDELRRHDTDVTCVTTSKWEQAGPEWVEADVRDTSAISKLIQRIKPDEIYHLAALSKPTGDDYREYFDVNLYGTLNVLNAARDCGACVVVVGSAYAYGKQDGPIREDSAFNPVNVYGASKAAQDALGSSYSYDNQVIRVRPFNHTGAGQDVSYLVPGLVKRMMEAGNTGASISIGNTSAVRDFLDVRDVVSAYRILARETSESDVYNVCSGIGRSVDQVFDVVKNCLGYELTYETTEDLLRESDIEMLVGDPSKIAEQTSWKQMFKFEETICTIVDFFENKNGVK